MVIIFITIICLVMGYVTYETIKQKQQIKNYERDNKKRAENSKSTKEKPKRRKKVSKNKTQNKRKPRGTKKENRK